MQHPKITEFVQRLKATGATNIKLTPMSYGRIAIKANAPDWGVGDRGWNKSYSHRHWTGKWVVSKVLLPEHAPGVKVGNVFNEIKPPSTIYINSEYKVVYEYKPVYHGPKHKHNPSIYYQFWPEGYLTNSTVYPTKADGTTDYDNKYDVKKVHHAGVHSNWDLAPAGVDGKYRCRWCEKRIVARQFSSHSGWVKGKTCRVLVRYRDIAQVVSKELDPSNIIWEQKEGESYIKVGKRVAAFHKHVHKVALSRARG